MASIVESLGLDSDRALGVVYTPPKIVDFMFSLVNVDKSPLKVLELACVDASFLRAFSDHHGDHYEFVGVEIDPSRLSKARDSFSKADFVEADFLLYLTRPMLERVPVLGIRREDFGIEEAGRIAENSH